MDSINRALRVSQRSAATTVSRMQMTAAMLPNWIEVGHTVCYVSKSSAGMTHHVKISKIEERKQTVLVVFESNQKVWKRIPFSEISKLGDGSLRPLWKPEPVMSTVPSKPSGPPAKEEVEAMATSPEKPAAGAAAVVDSDEEERKEQMERRMRRMQQLNANKPDNSRSRSPKKKGKSVCYVPGHMDFR
eukprot:TRINITY_DN50583_c0_g1_i1.p1 TRINITY_DN50583_c0_g1~~TRINITY_DN50583_c0_g1_i1.p1  ORF type:complete len:188 (+),score=48.96 TRINITY_DN50583_c0_g1_i1:110-673(+)